MNYGLHISASGLSAQIARQNVLSNNLANVHTTAFKPDVFALRSRPAARHEDGLGLLPSNALLERLSAGVMPVPTRINLAQGPLERTGNPLDLGIEGPGFFVVRAGPGDDGLRLTRDGRFTLSPDGRLVRSADGLAVLDTSGQPIRVDPSRPVSIGEAGEIRQNGAIVARITLVSVNDPSRLSKAGGGLFRAPVNEALSPAAGRIVPEFVEASATNAIDAMVAVTSASRAVAENASIITRINEMMGHAVNTLGRAT